MTRRTTPTVDLPARRRCVGLLLALPAAFLATLPPGCASPWRTAPDPDVAADQRAELRIRAALNGALDLAAAAIGVAVVDGVATLDGFTATEAERQRAVAAARGVDGIMEVRDRIEVRGTAR